MPIFKKAAFTLIATGFAALPLLAQDEGDDAGWRAECRPEQNICVSVLHANNSENGARVASLAVQVDTDGTNPRIGVITPLGVAVQQPVFVTVGDNTQEIEIDTCVPEGCRATHEITDEDFNALFDAETITMGFLMVGGSAPVEIPFPGEGLRDSFTDKVTLSE